MVTRHGLVSSWFWPVGISLWPAIFWQALSSYTRGQVALVQALRWVDGTNPANLLPAMTYVELRICKLANRPDWQNDKQKSQTIAIAETVPNGIRGVIHHDPAGFYECCRGRRPSCVLKDLDRRNLVVALADCRL
jgi:hypothetical protein